MSKHKQLSMRATDPERGIETLIKSTCRNEPQSMRATDPERGIETFNHVAGRMQQGQYEGHRSRTGD